MWLDLESEILEEFGRHSAAGFEENVWTAQAEAAREHKQLLRQRERRPQPPSPAQPARVNQCADCSQPVQPGKRRCAAHLEHDLARAASARDRKVQSGECLDCPKPSSAGRRRCAEHLVAHAQKAAVARQRPRSGQTGGLPQGHVLATSP